MASFVLVFTYIPCAYVIDRKGIRFMKLGSLCITLQFWIWYLNDAGVFGTPSVIPVLVAKVLTNIFNPLVSTSLLAVSNRWFPAKERAKATATVALVSTMGAVLVAVVGPSFETTVDVIDLSLKSCKPSSATLAKFNASLVNGTTPFCDTADNDAAEFRDFCCVADANVVLYALVIAVLSTLVTLFTFVVVKDAPPTPPSGALENVSLLPNFCTALSHMAKYRNYMTLCAADFIVSGPPIVLNVAIARMLPPVIKNFDFAIAAAGIALSIPAAAIVAYLLDKNNKYFEWTWGGYTTGAVSWIVATVCFAAGDGGAYAMIGLLVLGIVSFTAWQAAVYETKLEYIYTKEFQLEGLIVGIDRLLINLSTVIFVAIMAPETVGGPQMTFAIGCAPFIIGALLPVTIPTDQKRDYKRLQADDGISGAISADSI